VTVINPVTNSVSLYNDEEGPAPSVASKPEGGPVDDRWQVVSVDGLDFGEPFGKFAETPWWRVYVSATDDKTVYCQDRVGDTWGEPVVIQADPELGGYKGFWAFAAPR
jgi:hypothetical protein